MKKLAIITTHPIQYYAPVFQLLHQRKQISIKVFYTWGQKAEKKYDPGFGKVIQWDIPLLDHYPFEWVMNTASEPGSQHFNGIINPALNKQIEKLNPDAILIFGWAYNSHLKAMRFFKNKIPIYFRGDSTLLDEKKDLKFLFKSFYLKWVYKHVDHAFYVGTNNKAYFKKYGLNEEQLSFAPHAVDNNRFGVDRSTEADALRNRMGISPDDLVIIFAGKFEKKKNPELLMDAFLRLDPDNCHLLFIGNGVLETGLKNAAQNSAKIHFLDFQNQGFMPVIYQCGDLFCLPSKGPGETWGLAVNEAMASAKPVLVSNKAGCAIDLVNGRENGAIFRSGDPDDLSKKLSEMTLSRVQLTNLGKNSLLRIRDWNFTNIALAIETKLFNEKKRPD